MDKENINSFEKVLAIPLFRASTNMNARQSQGIEA